MMIIEVLMRIRGHHKPGVETFRLDFEDDVDFDTVEQTVKDEVDKRIHWTWKVVSSVKKDPM